MAQALRPRRKRLLEEKIERFCQDSAELLADIHARCDKTAEGVKGKKSKRGRKKIDNLPYEVGLSAMSQYHPV